MQIKYLYLDGSLKSLQEHSDQGPAGNISHALSESQLGDGLHVIIGEHLDGPTRAEVYQIVASTGVLICQNVLNPE